MRDYKYLIVRSEAMAGGLGNPTPAASVYHSQRCRECKREHTRSKTYTPTAASRTRISRLMSTAVNRDVAVRKYGVSVRTFRFKTK